MLVRKELSEFDNMEAVLYRFRGEACQMTAACLIELFVALKSKGRSLMQIQKEILRRGDPRRQTMHPVSFRASYRRSRIQELRMYRGVKKEGLMCHCVTNIRHHVET